MDKGGHTVSARLDGSLDIPNALDRNTVLVIPIDVLVLQLANFIQENAELVCHIRDILVARFTPDGKLLLFKRLVDDNDWISDEREHTATSMRSLATVSKLRMTFFSILTSCESFLARSGPNAPAALRLRAWPSHHVSLGAIDNLRLAAHAPVGLEKRGEKVTYQDQPCRTNGQTLCWMVGEEGSVFQSQ
jgi:hypothetical protein